MSIELLTIIIGGLTIGAALMVVISKHPIRSVLFLVVTFFLISSLYILMNAQFLAIVNIIVYAGAIMVLFLFVLMLLNLNKESEPKTPKLALFSSVLASGILLLVLIAAFKDSLRLQHVRLPQQKQIGLVENLGKLLFDEYIVPFEVSSILFIASMVGAILLAKREKPIID
jgi:NADH-quinone oxidoreductase subunit J